MKHLKIYFAILFLSFLGSTQNQLFAQTKEGSWTRTFNLTDVLENEDYKAKLEMDAKLAHKVMLVIYKASDNSIVRRVDAAGIVGTTFKSLTIQKSGKENEVSFCINEEPAEKFPNCRTLSADSRQRGNLANFKVLNTTVEPTESAYLQLEADGRVVIYSGTGGTPILELLNPW
jgi:hypothetical protein